jgi:Polysaccharide biosynthesis/export protein
MLESKTGRVWFCATLLLCAISCGGVLHAQEKRSPAPLATGEGDYHIAPGDVIQIDVWKEPEITLTTLVRPDGKISLPILNDVKAAGLTTMQLAGVIHDGLTKHLTNPQVTVTITGIADGTKFLVIPPPLHPIKVPPPVSPDLKQKCCAA